MYLTATSSEIIELTSKINFLQNSFDWIIGGVGISVSVAIILVGIIQTITQDRKINLITEKEVSKIRKELEDIKENTIADINKQLKEQVDQIYDQLKNELSVAVTSVKNDVESTKSNFDIVVKSLEDRVLYITSKASGEISRSFAIYNQEKSFFRYHLPGGYNLFQNMLL